MVEHMGFAFADPQVLTDEQRAAVANHARHVRDQSSRISLQAMREATELTQEELAAAMKLSVDRIARMETGDLDRVQLATLRRYASALGAQLEVTLVRGNTHVDASQNK